MGGDCAKPDCIFKHDPLVKDRSDLIPTCNLIRQKGACDRPACTFNHPKQSAKAARKLAAQLAKQSALVASSPANAPTATQTQEVSELKAMIVGLVQQQHLAAAAIATLSGTPHKSAVPSEHLSSVAAVSTLIHPVSQPASLLNKTNRSLSDPSTVQPPPPVRPRMARIRSKVKAYKAKVKATQQASLKSTLTACLLIDTVMRTVGLDPTHNKVCAGNLVHPLSKVVTSCADSAATTDFLAGQHSREALNKVELSHPLPIATAGHDTLVTHRGDLTLGNGL